MGNCSGAVRLSQSLNMPAVIKSGHKILALALLLQNAQLSDQTDFYQLTAADINGKQVDFARYEGAAVLVVNVASECGYTDSHYRGLKRLHDILGYNNKLAILGFPCNQFGGQEPGAKDQIRDVAFNKYQVKFQMFGKVDVIGQNQHPVWKHLTETSGISPQWNFYKYLLDHHGNIVQAWPPPTRVEDIFDAVQAAVQDAEGEVQVESPLGSHDEL